MGIMGVLTVIFAIASIASIGVIGNGDQAFAGGFCESDDDGPWDSADTWNDECDDEGIPGEFQLVIVQHAVTISTDVVREDWTQVNPNGVLTVKNGASLTSSDSMLVENGDPLPTFIIEQGGTVDISVTFGNGGDTFNYGTMNLEDFENNIFDTFHNKCTGIVNIASEGSNLDGFLVINHGTFNFNNPAGAFQNSGIFQNSGMINGGFQNINDGTLVPISSICNLVGGTFIPIDTTALLLAGIQTNALWIMSTLAIIGSVAFGAVYITVKRN